MTDAESFLRLFVNLFVSVFFVSHQGVTYGSQMSTDLMASSCDQQYPYQSITFPVRDRRILCGYLQTSRHLSVMDRHMIESFIF